MSYAEPSLYGERKNFSNNIFMIIGLLIALNRKILPLSLVFFLTYVGSLFSKGNGKIYTTVLFFFLIGLYLSKKIPNYFRKKQDNSLLNFYMILFKIYSKHSQLYH